MKKSKENEAADEASPETKAVICTVDEALYAAVDKQVTHVLYPDNQQLATKPETVTVQCEGKPDIIVKVLDLSTVGHNYHASGHPDYLRVVGKKLRLIIQYPQPDEQAS